MDWKSAIAQLKNIEGTADSVGILEAEINRLTNANFELVKDVRAFGSKVKESESKLTDLLQLLGAEGDDLKAKATSANEKVKALQNDLSKATKEKTEIETKYTSLETETNGLKRRTVIHEAAAVSGAVADVLTTLTKDIPVEQILVDSGEAWIVPEEGKKIALKEYASEKWSAFVPALFPSGNSQNNSRLPGGSPSGGKSQEVSPLKAYRASTYDRTVEKMTNKSS